MHHLKANNIYIDVWFGQYLKNLENEGAKKNGNIENIIFKVVSNAYTNQKLSLWNEMY